MKHGGAAERGKDKEEGARPQITLVCDSVNRWYGLGTELKRLEAGLK